VKVSREAAKPRRKAKGVFGSAHILDLRYGSQFLAHIWLALIKAFLRGFAASREKFST